MSAARLDVAHSFAALAPDNPLRRLPRAPHRARPDAFTAAFDARTLFYDCFRHADGARILLVGPPPLNLRPALKQATLRARPSGAPLKARFFASLSTMVTELRGAPADTTAIEIAMGGEIFVLAVQPNGSAALSGRKLLFSVNKDNELGWIREWATFHARVHGTDAVLVFDNGSTRYGTDEIAAVLAEVPGLAQVGVASWPHSFGPIDPAVRANPYWARFLQIATMSVVLRRYGAAAYGLLDCDIDELAGTRSGRSIYDLARASRGGLVAFRGIWIEAVGAGPRHRDFTRRLADAEAATSRPRKWALDPSRAWVRRLCVHPYWHWIAGRPFWAKTMPEDALYWHFRAINTNWKQARTRPPVPTAELETDLLLAASFARLAP
jgi:hypothetical protein